MATDSVSQAFRRLSWISTTLPPRIKFSRAHWQAIVVHNLVVLPKGEDVAFV